MKESKIIETVKELYSLVGTKITFAYSDLDNGSQHGTVIIDNIEKVDEDYRCFDSKGVFLFSGSFVTEGKKYRIKNGMYGGDDFALIEYKKV